MIKRLPMTQFHSSKTSYGLISKTKRMNFTSIFWKSQKDKKVDFIIGGTQKGGTTALHAYLKEHQEICLANRKEVHFFDNEKIFKKKVNYSLYHSFFNPASQNKLLGEATPIYMYWQDAPRRIWEYNPKMKWIIILRNPIERAFSHWNMERNRGAEILSFTEAIQNETDRCREALPYQHRVYSYIDRGFYVEQLRRIWRYFSREQTLILRTEDLKEKPKETLDTVCSFLGIDYLRELEHKEVHTTPYISAMNDWERSYLLDIFEYDIRNLEKMLGWDCSKWLN